MDQFDTPIDRSAFCCDDRSAGAGALSSITGRASSRFPTEYFPSLTATDLSVSVGRLPDLTPAEVQEIIGSLVRFGAALVLPDTPAQRNELLSLSAHFGGVVRHKDSDDSGVTTLSAAGGRGTSWGNSTLPQPPHTDGMYLRGGPPRLLALLAEQMPAEGGRSILTSGEELYRRLRCLGPDVLGALFRHDALKLAVDGKEIARPVLRLLTADSDAVGAPGEVGLAFRSGRFSRSSSSRAAKPGVDLIRSFVANEENQVRFHIPEGAVLLVTNTGRVLHGREGWSKSEPRKLHRLWLDGAGALGAYRHEIFGIPSSPERSGLGWESRPA